MRRTLYHIWTGSIAGGMVGMLVAMLWWGDWNTDPQAHVNEVVKSGQIGMVVGAILYPIHLYRHRSKRPPIQPEPPVTQS